MALHPVTLANSGRSEADLNPNLHDRAFSRPAIVKDQTPLDLQAVRCTWLATSVVAVMVRSSRNSDRLVK
jgi:hypothetical protein